MGALGVVVAVGVYVALGRFILTWQPGQMRDAAFALLNLAGIYALFFPFGYAALTAVFVAYILLAVVQHTVLRFRGGALLAFVVPIAALIGIKTAPYLVGDSLALPGGESLLTLSAAVIGISYFAFRTSYLVIEVRNGVVPLPTLWRYLAYCFFAPTIAVGPINRYSTFVKSLDAAPDPAGRATMTAALRLLVGAVKFRVLSGMLDQLSYAGLLLDGHPHHWLDLIVAAVAYYLYLYCNFSGFVDMAIGAAGLLGIRVEENFNNPFAARNMRDFWNRWHMTLGIYMRDVVFTPLSKHLSRALGSAAASHATALAIATVFVLIGVWHMPGLNYLAFGVMHALGVVAVHYYTLALKRGLGRERFQAYMASRGVHALALSLTFIYATASHFLFANSFADMRAILAAVGWI
jgi:D-alanyl-lipoteichoic acid acyltransferase DltB (MBOAT superfamily)